LKIVKLVIPFLYIKKIVRSDARLEEAEIDGGVAGAPVSGVTTGGFSSPLYL
jgi:hypothetical protein